ncbi:Cupin domain-containing protein [Mariprofundus ferrinatatus]|uniref:Cupin domain-containing protein n=1 Tax=Mariprofundus ferrinatatus TaxID=1921087 RepID=A0A2K8L4R3_9PROT|nr:cupin domain-containing protein [Mariprofundus ferrinatatus]ATX82310.1 Cupin domain-containing protein [Mariprofundus ferrinatatus]
MKVVETYSVATEGVSHDPDILKRVLLHESELPGSVRFSHATFTPGQKVAAHCHEDICEVFYILSGTCRFTVNGEAVDVREGSVIRIDAGEMHEVINVSNMDLTMIYFGLKVEKTGPVVRGL